jgi:hypothetical protein
MKPDIFIASLATACGIYAGTMALALCSASAAVVRAVARHLPVGNPHHLPAHRGTARGLQIGHPHPPPAEQAESAACACSAGAYRGSNDNGAPRRRLCDLVAGAMKDLPMGLGKVKIPDPPTALPCAAGLPSA